MARVYVSSTYSDLVNCRKAVSAALRKLGHDDIAMEHYAADPRRPLDRCLEDVASADLYVGIFAWRYGYIPPGQNRSITELEYRHARKTGRDCLIFLLSETAPWPPDQIESDAYDRIVAFRNELKTHTGIAEFTGSLDLAAAVTTAVALWQTSGRAPRSVQLAPPLPAHYIKRSRILHDITALLSDRPGEAGVLMVIALHGLGGTGKTAAATAIAHSPAIRDRFGHGILWATLGPNPDVLSHLTAWIHALGDPQYRPTTAIAATSYLRTLLYTTSTLLIVDDVWEFEHAAPFLAGGPRCGLLVTTRRAEVADGLGAQLYDIAAMTRAEAVELLRTRVETGRRGRALTKAELEQAAALAADTGYLPLALALMGGLVARGYAWADARTALQRKQSSRGGSASHDQSTLEASLQLSLEYLRKIDPRGWERVARLGVLADDAVINARIASVIWEMPRSAANQFLNSLADDAILQRANLEFRIHDLMRDVVRNALTANAPEGMGIPLAQAHAELLAQYGRTIASHRWDQLEDDGYIHSHLVWHFEQAGDLDAIHALLKLSDEDGRPAWYVVRDQLGQAAGFISDLAVGWRLVRDEATFSLGEQCGYALVLASLHSLAQVITPRMLYILVRRKIWRPEKALDYLRRGTDLHRRAAALLQLIPIVLEQSDDGSAHLNRNNLLETLLREAEATIEAGVGAMPSARLLIVMATQYSGYQQQELLQRAIAYTDGKPSTLRGLARDLVREMPALRDALLQQAAENCSTIADPLERVEALVDVVIEFSSHEMKAKWVPVVKEWIEQLFVLANRNDSGPRGTEIASRRAGPESDVRVQLLRLLFDRKIVTSKKWFLRMAKYLPAAERRFVLAYLDDPPEQTEAGDEVRRTFESLLAERQYADLNELVALVPDLARGREQAVSDIMKAYSYLTSEEKGELLTRLSPYLSEDVCRREIENLRTSHGYLPVGAACLLANLEPEGERRQRFDGILASFKSIWASYDTGAAVTALIRIAPPEVVHRLIASLQRIDDTEEQIGAVFVAAPHLADGLSPEMVEFLEDRSANRAQIMTLTRMVVELSNAMKGGVLVDFVREAARISSEWWIVEALTLTMLRLHDRERLSAILRAVKFITASDLKARLVNRLAIRMARLGYVRDAVDATAAIPLASDRWIALTDLAIDLVTAGQIVDARKVAAAIAHPEERGKATAEIALHVASRGEVQQARVIADGVTHELWRMWIQERLDLNREGSQFAPPPTKRAAVTASTAEQLDFESIRALADELSIHDLAAAAAANDARQTVAAIGKFWRAKFRGEQTYLETIAEQPRPKLLKKLQEVAPLLTPALEASEAQKFVSAVRNVSVWWP